MKLQDASRKELTRIAVGTVLCSAVLVGILYVLSLVGVGTFELSRILLGVVLGDLIAIGNFYALCITVQKAVGIEDQKQMKMKFQLSYNFRMMTQAVWVVVALLVPQIHVVAGAVPLLFPHAIILFMQRHGKIASPARAESEKESQQDEPQA